MLPDGDQHDRTLGVKKSRWTEAEIRALGVRLDGVVAVQILTNYSRSRCYEILRNPEELPEVRVLKIGRRYIVPTADVLRALGLEPSLKSADSGQPSPSVVESAPWERT